MRAALGTNNVDHCTRLCHASSVAALLEGIGSGAVSDIFAPRQARRPDPAHRHEHDGQPSGRGDVLQAGGEAARHEAHRRGAAPAGHRRLRHAWYCQIQPGTDVAFYNAIMHVLIARGLARRRLHREPHRELRGAEGDGRELPAGARRAASAASRPKRSARSPGSSARREEHDHLLGHGHQPAHARHRQRPLPDRAVPADAATSAGRAPGCIRSAARTTCRAHPTPG